VIAGVRLFPRHVLLWRYHQWLCMSFPDRHGLWGEAVSNYPCALRQFGFRRRMETHGYAFSLVNERDAESDVVSIPPQTP
jgi:hypothetical protein